MVKLFCAVVGAGMIFSVDVKLSESVHDLKSKIKKRSPNLIHFNAALLKLYMAREGNTWLKSQDEAIKALRAKQCPDRINNLMQEHLLLDETMRLRNDAFIGNNFEDVEYDIHLLVKCPDEDQVMEYKRTEQNGFVDTFVETVDSLVENLFSWHLPWSMFPVKEKRA